MIDTNGKYTSIYTLVYKLKLFLSKYIRWNVLLAMVVVKIEC